MYEFQKNDRVIFFKRDEKGRFFPMHGYVMAVRRNWLGFGAVKEIDVKTVGFSPDRYTIPVKLVFDRLDLSSVCFTTDKKTVFSFFVSGGRVALENLSTGEKVEVNESFFKSNFVTL